MQSVREEDTAWHCGRSDGKYKHPACRNANSIGIEMCCHQDAKGGWYIDEATMAAAAESCSTPAPIRRSKANAHSSVENSLRFIVFTPYYNLCRNGDTKSNVFVTFVTTL